MGVGGVLVLITVISVQESSLRRVRRKYDENTMLIAEKQCRRGQVWRKMKSVPSGQQVSNAGKRTTDSKHEKSRRDKLLISSVDWFCMIAVFGRKHTLHAKPKPQQIKPLTMIIFAFSVLGAHERWSAPDSRGDYRGSLASSWWTRLPALWRRI